MGKEIVWLFVFILVIGLVCSSDDWESISSGDGSVDDVTSGGSGDTTSEVTSNSDDSSSGSGGQESSGNGDVSDDILPSFLSNDKYTLNFYVALGLAGIGVLIILLFIYLFIRGPKNKFNKRIVKKKVVKKKGKKGKQKGK